MRWRWVYWGGNDAWRGRQTDASMHACNAAAQHSSLAAAEPALARQNIKEISAGAHHADLGQLLAVQHRQQHARGAVQLVCQAGRRAEAGR